VEKMNAVLDLRPGTITLDPLATDAVAARFRLTFTARSSGEHVGMDLIEIYTMRNGLIMKLDVSYKDPSAVAALITG
jgi:ketosteroid isomerase-like protein